MNKSQKDFVERVKSKMYNSEGVKIESEGIKKIKVDKKPVKIKVEDIKLKEIGNKRISNKQIIKNNPRATIKVNVDDYNLLSKMQRDKQRFFNQNQEFLYK